MTATITLNPAQLQAIQDGNARSRDRIARATTKVLNPGREFVFFAAFDGTNNDKDDLAGDRQCTNVGQLWEQYAADTAKERGNLGGAYYAGLGTRGRPTKETWLSSAVTAQVLEIARRAQTDLTRQASDWLSSHPGGSVRVVLTGFSRGTASAAAFAQLVQRDGVQGAARTDVAAGVLFDPVATGVKGNVALPPAARNIVVLRALNEYRQLFRAVDYTGQSDQATTFGLFGNHCDVGGGYDNGLAALSLDAATAFLRSAGLPLAKVPAARAFERTQLAVHTEQFDDAGHPIWDVTNADGFSFEDRRLFDAAVVVAPAADSGGRKRFALFDGSEIAV